MKAKFVLGMVVLAGTMSFSQVYAADVHAAKSTKEMLADYTKTIKDAVFKGGNPASISKDAEGKLIDELQLSSDKKASLIAALDDKATRSARLESLATAVAVKRMSVEVAKKDAAEGKSLSDAAGTIGEFLSNADLIGALPTVPGLEGAELTDTTAALKNLSTKLENIMLNFSKSERDAMIQVMHRTVELEGQRKAPEQALLQAIMDVKKVDRTKAMELIRKLKECV